MEILTCEILDLKRILNEGILFRPNRFEAVRGYDFQVYHDEKQLHIGVDSSGLWFMCYNYRIYHKDHGKTWWFKDEYNE